MTGHGIETCACGNIVRQCRCPEHHEPRVVQPDCEKCRMPAPTKRASQCDHTHFRSRVTIETIVEYAKAKPYRRLANVSIVCVTCGTPFRFVGVAGGLAPDRPMVSPFGDELRAPIEPANLDGQEHGH